VKGNRYIRGVQDIQRKIYLLSIAAAVVFLISAQQALVPAVYRS